MYSSRTDVAYTWVLRASTQIPLEEYLSTCYEPDREYVDGELVERFVGEFEHSRLQMMIAAYFFNKEAEFGIMVFPEQRVRVKNTDREKRYRIPDVSVVRVACEKETVLTKPPYLVVEVLSPDDRASNTLLKASEYARFGIRGSCKIRSAGKFEHHR